MQNVDFGGFLESLEFTHFQRYRKFLLSDQRHHLKDSLWNKLFVDRASDFLFLFPQHFFDALVSTFCETQLPISDTRIDRKCCFFVVFCS